SLPLAVRLADSRNDLIADLRRGLLEHAGDAIGPVDVEALDPAENLPHILVALALEALAHPFVLDRHGGFRIVDPVEAAGRQPFLRERALPGGENLHRIDLPRRI